MGVTLRNTLAEAVKHTAPSFLGTVGKTQVPELSEKIQNVKTRALQLQKEHQSQNSRFSTTSMHPMPLGPFAATVIGQILVIKTHWKDSTAGQKFLSFCTLGGALLTAGCAGFAYGQYYFGKDEPALKININQTGQSHETFKFLKSSVEMLEKCSNPKSLKSLKDAYENFKIDMLNGVQQETVPTELYIDWLTLDPIINADKAIPKELLDHLKSEIIRYKNLLETTLQPFREKAKDDTSTIRSISIEEDFSVEMLIKELDKLIDDSFTINQNLKTEQPDESAPTLSELYTKFTPVGGWCATTTGVAAELIDYSSKQSIETTAWEAVTLGAALCTGFLTTFVYFKHKDHIFVKKLRDEITKHTASMLEIIHFLEDSHDAANLCMNKEASLEVLREKCKNFKNRILYSPKKNAIYNSLYDHWKEARFLTKQKPTQNINNIDDDDFDNHDNVKISDQNAIKKEVRQVMKGKILPYIRHHISLYDTILPPIKAQEATGCRSWRIVKYCFGDPTPKQRDLATLEKIV
ncbi:MAG: hypothetical protein V4494_06010 [Chlamydiota bacterium]